MIGTYDIRLAVGQLPQKLQRAASRAEDMTSAWRVAGEILLRSIRRNFDAGGRPTPWAPWAPSTARRKKPGDKILIQSARLMKSITYTAMPDCVKVGTDVIYGATHQFGRGAIPARPFIWVQPEDNERIAGVLKKYLVGDLG